MLIQYAGNVVPGIGQNRAGIAKKEPVVVVVVGPRVTRQDSSDF